MWARAAGEAPEQNQLTGSREEAPGVIESWLRPQSAAIAQQIAADAALASALARGST